MEIKIYLNNGLTFSANAPEFDGTKFAQGINDPQMQVASFGDIVINKHAILLIAPADVVTPNE
ncbi:MULTISPECIES: hypothetical protein [unclassified Sporosarcina]|uniref:hypothetical protein n=1 Tax=unclassified Sporosarcina TaxID=2647733 RepID=UPI002041C184|nr:MULTISPECIES: hypothetical protein [unclassified Sporosarcina]GKV67292.1 hypothetical protein NCCP2331_34450 [Sporosarcina sp. NCCP-2331]GLB57647.1 hypothetical protein NCCP2378_34370 [Sporosarcina sp. NCCP-2378]